MKRVVSRIFATALCIFTSATFAADNDFQNFSALDHFRAANASLKADPSRVVFMGDSITEAWGKEPLFANAPHWVDRGISGQTTPQMLLRFRSDVIDLHPALVHIMAGTNDVARNAGVESDEDIESMIASMVDLALANHINVIVASIPPTIEFPWRRGLHPAPRIQRLNAWLKSYAEKMHVAYVDYWPALANADGSMKAELSSDGVHPNAEGYRRMQPITQAAIASALSIHH